MLYHFGGVVIDDETLSIQQGYYANGRPSIELFAPMEMDGTYAVLSVNLPDQPLADDEFFAKTWGENQHIRKPMLECGFFEDTGKRVPTGFVEAEVWRFTKTKPVPL